MATRADVLRAAEANAQNSELARDDVRRLWATLDTGDAMLVREALEDLLPDLVFMYGEMAATVAADAYDEARAQAGARGRFSAVLAAPVAVEAVRANSRWAIGPLFSATPSPVDALGRLDLIVDRMVLQPGRDTRMLSARRDPARPRFARVPTSPMPCAFCTMAASRGPVYHTEASAGGMTDWHAHCNCEVIEVYGDQPLPEGYDPDALFQQYADGRDAAGSSDPKKVLAAMRELHGIR